MPLTESVEPSGTAPTTGPVPATAPVIAKVSPLKSVSVTLPEPPRMALPDSVVVALSSIKVPAGASLFASGPVYTSVMVAVPTAVRLLVTPLVRVAVSVKFSLTSLIRSAVIAVRTST